MSKKDLDLDDAYALRTPEDALSYYREWAERYDTGFAEAMKYRQPDLVAEAFARDGQAPVLDVGAGTGLVAAALARHGVGPVDGIDISPDMLAVAATKGLYRNLTEANLLHVLPIASGSYAGIVSAGTFTHGHVGPDALDELLRVAKPGALFVLSINAEVYISAGFERKLADLGRAITELDLQEVAIYGEGSDDAHAQDRALIVTFRKSSG